ncbi:hypothetical protein GW915_01180 [bacterium]|nr:hypothetical protein [bacterium]
MQLRRSFLLSLLIPIATLALGPAPAPTPKKSVIAAIGDFNKSKGRSTLPPIVINIFKSIREISSLSYTLGLGDFYETLYGADAEAEAKVFFNGLAQHYLAGGHKFFPTLGNHDTPSRLREHATAKWKQVKSDSVFPLLSDGSRCDLHYPKMYCFLEEGVFNISLDDSCDSYRICNWTEQSSWLKKVFALSEELKRNGDSVATIVFGHVPLYSNAQDPRTSDSKLYENGHLSTQRGHLDLESLEGMLVRYSDLFITAHTHVPYPGYMDYQDGHRLRTLSIPCSGSHPRDFYTGSRNPMKGFPGYALIEVDGTSGEIRTEIKECDSSSCATFNKENFPSNLPTNVNGVDRYIDTRLDPKGASKAL